MARFGAGCQSLFYLLDSLRAWKRSPWMEDQEWGRAGILDLQIHVQRGELRAIAVPPWDKEEHSKDFISSGCAMGPGQKVVHLKEK